MPTDRHIPGSFLSSSSTSRPVGHDGNGREAVARARIEAVSLLDADPDLGANIPPSEQALAHQLALAPVLRLEGPEWDPASLPAAACDSGCLGLLLLDGVLVRRVSVASQSSCELLGSGDMLRPWDEDDLGPLPVRVEWLVLGRARVAVLDRRFALRVARWPALYGQLLQRATAGPRRLAITQAVTHMTRSHARLLLVFWLLAERWGRVVPDGVVIDLPLTHQLLAALVGNRRPSVTLALQRLAADRLLVRQTPRRWLLTTRAIERLRDPDGLAVLGDTHPAAGPDDIDDVESGAPELAELPAVA